LWTAVNHNNQQKMIRLYLYAYCFILALTYPKGNFINGDAPGYFTIPTRLTTKQNENFRAMALSLYNTDTPIRKIHATTTLLAVHFGQETGFALAMLDSDRANASGSFNFAASRYSSDARCRRFRDRLDDLHGACAITRVCYTWLLHHAAMDRDLIETLIAWCDKRGIVCEAGPNGETNLFATGNGRAPRGAVTTAVAEWGYPVEDDSHAGAIALLHCKLTQMCVPRTPEPPANFVETRFDLTPVASASVSQGEIA
jgi:hypothetical protein